MDSLDNKYVWRRKIYNPEIGFTFFRSKNFKDNDGTNMHPQHDYVDYNSKGDIVPRRIFNYPMADEKIFRI